MERRPRRIVFGEERPRQVEGEVHGVRIEGQGLAQQVGGLHRAGHGIAEHGQRVVVEPARRGLRLREGGVHAARLAVAAQLQQGHALDEARLARDAATCRARAPAPGSPPRTPAARAAGVRGPGARHRTPGPRPARCAGASPWPWGRGRRGRARRPCTPRRAPWAAGGQHFVAAARGRRGPGQRDVPGEAVDDFHQPLDGPAGDERRAERGALHVEEAQGERDALALDGVGAGDEPRRPQRLRHPHRRRAAERHVGDLQPRLRLQALRAADRGHSDLGQRARELIGDRLADPGLRGAARGLQREHQQGVARRGGSGGGRARRGSGRGRCGEEQQQRLRIISGVPGKPMGSGGELDARGRPHPGVGGELLAQAGSPAARTGGRRGGCRR